MTIQVRLDFSDIPETLVQIKKFTVTVMDQLIVFDLAHFGEVDVKLVECTKLLIIKVRAHAMVLEDPKRIDYHEKCIGALQVYIDLLAQHYNLMCHLVTKKSNDVMSDVIHTVKPCNFFPIHTVDEYIEESEK